LGPEYPNPIKTLCRMNMVLSVPRS